MKILDFRSDTITKPTKEMRAAMAEAEVGDDVYRDDKTVIALEEYCAALLNKPAALFFPSGTMANQVAIMTHTSRGDQLITHEHYHTVTHEVGGLSVLSGVFPKTIKSPDDFIAPEDFLKAISSADIHEPPTTLLCLENATFHGTVYSLKQLEELYPLAKKNNIKVHLDGARIFNAAIALNTQASEIAKYADSVMFCLSKGLCAPIGSMLVGSKEFIEKARRNRKMLGGGLRQVGVLAAAGLIAVKDMPKLLINDHQNAKELADTLALIPEIKITAKTEINMVYFRFTKPIDHQVFYQHLKNNNILINPSNDEYRLVTNHDVNRQDCQFLAQTIKDFL